MGKLHRFEVKLKLPPQGVLRPAGRVGGTVCVVLKEPMKMSSLQVCFDRRVSGEAYRGVRKCIHKMERSF